MSSFKSALCAALCLLGSGTAHSTILVNGGFEQPTTSGDLFIPAGDPSLVGWTIVSGSIDVVSNSGSWPAFAGAQSLDLDGRSAGTIEQAFATMPGTAYILSFEYANNPGGLPSANVSVLGAAALLSQNISHSTSTAADMDWTQFVESFTADSATTTLRFASLDGPSSFWGIALDAVSVSPSPCPNPPRSLCSGSVLRD